MSSSWKIDKLKNYPKLTADTEADTVVVGGGLAGVWCAYLLAKAGIDVLLVEKKKLGSGETEYTTAFLNQTIDTALADLVKMFGEEEAKLVWQSHRDAIDLIEKTIKEERIECEFKRTPVYVYVRDEKEYKYLKEEHECATKLGFSTDLLPSPRLGFKVHGAMIIRNQAKYHPMKFLENLALASEEIGARIHEGTEVEEISSKGGLKVLLKNGRVIKAKKVVIATYDPLGNPKETKFKKGMYTSYVYELKVKSGSLPEAMYLDMHNPYHYVRVDRVEKREDRIIVGGEDHRAELKVPAAKNFKALKEYIDDTFPNLVYKIDKKWSGAILEPSDGLALIGEFSPNKFVACAFSGNGMTYSALTGMLISDLITGRPNPYEKIYDPKRKMRAKAVLTKARDYSEELIGGAARNIFK